MNKLYMIEFELHGKFHMANVFESQHSPPTYYVALLGHELIPNKLVFKEVDGKIELSPASHPASEYLREAIIQAIEKDKDGRH